MQLRTLGIEDAQAWFDLRLEALESDPFAFGSSAEEHRALSPETIAERVREKPESAFTIGAFDGGRLVGMATFLRETRLKHRHKGLVVGVCVAASHRRQGIAAALMTELIEKARREHPALEQLALAVTADNDPALRLYRRLGFTTFGTEPRALKIGSAYAAMEHMVLIFQCYTRDHIQQEMSIRL